MRTWAVRLATWWARRMLRRGFDGVEVRGLEAARAVVARGPVVLAANHVAWWDGVVMLVVGAALGARSRFLMEDAQLARMPWVRALGAIGVDRLAPRRALTEAARALEGPGDAVWIFPQGRQRPAGVRPLGLRPGVAWLGRRAPVVPVALTYGWRDRPSPTVIVAFGEPIEAADLPRLEAAIVAELDRTEAELDGGARESSALVPGAGRSPQDGLGARLLTWVAR